MARVQLDFSDKGFEELTQIRKLSETRSNAQTIRNALAVYRWYLEVKRDGDDILVRSEGALVKMRLIFPSIP